MRHWRPSHPLFPWFFCLVAVAITILPLICALAILTNSSSFLVSIASSLDDRLSQTIIFTVQQASLSTIIVLFLAPIFSIGMFFVPPFIQRISTLLRTLFFCLPSVVVATGIILTWGNNGLGTKILSTIGINSSFPLLVYSPYAVVLANGLMNLPFAALIIFRSLSAVPLEQLQSAVMLGIKPLSAWRNVFWPTIRPTLFYCGGMTFLLSLGSFGALSILGGGPRSQTLELGIYQAIYYDADWNTAAVFSVCHALIAGTVALGFIVPQVRLLNSNSSSRASDGINSVTIRNLIGRNKILRSTFLVLSIFLDLFLFLPIFAIASDATNEFTSFKFFFTAASDVLVASLFVSLSYAVPASLIASIGAWSVSRSFCRYKQRDQSNHAVLLLFGCLLSGTVPVMATSFGILALRSFFTNESLTSSPIIGLHAAMLLPFIINLTLPEYRQKISPFDRGRILDGIPNFKWMRGAEWPVLRNSVFMAFAVGVSLSINETAIVSMLGYPEKPTLTVTMIRLMGHYHFAESAVASSLLIIATSLIIWITSKRKVLP